jgi:hypothetical protein
MSIMISTQQHGAQTKSIKGAATTATATITIATASPTTGHVHGLGYYPGTQVHVVSS